MAYVPHRPAQWFILSAPHKASLQYSLCGRAPTFREVLFRRPKSSVARALARLLTVPVRPSCLYLAPTSDNRSSHQTTLLNLPPEIILTIFKRLASIQDVAALGLAHPHLWIGQAYLHAHLESFMGQWAGQKLIFVGSELLENDCPPGMYSAEEMGGWAAQIWGEEADLRLLPTSIYDHVMDLEWKGYNPQTFDEDTDFSSQLEYVFNQCWGRICQLGENGVGKYMESWLNANSPSESMYMPEDQTWILRNLTTKEIVRADAIAIFPELIHGPRIDVLGFGDVVLSRIGWASRENLGLPDSKGDIVDMVSRGVWAGHCFDITTLWRHNAAEQGVEWKDVSDEVVTEMDRIWGNEYGPNWRQTLYEQWVKNGWLEGRNEAMGTNTL